MIKYFLVKHYNHCSAGILGFIGGAGKALGEAGGRALLKNAVIKEVARDPAGFYSNGVYNSVGEYIGTEEEGGTTAALNSMLRLYQKDPMLRLIRLFTNGYWLNTYELPFYGNNYLEESNAGKWTQEGSKRSWGEGIATALEGFGVYYPTTPNWSLDITSAGRSEISTEFYLINKNEEWLLRNYKFMHALFSGTQFVMLKHCIVQSPNVYNVVVPGRFEIIWANVTMSATIEGKLRKCSHMYEELNMHYAEKNSQKTTQVADGNNSKAVRVAYSEDAFQALKAITPDTLWPDAWKISIKIKDLGVNCFNNYLNYQAYGSTGARLIANTTEKTQVDAAWSAIESTFKKYVDKLSGKEKEEAQKKLDSAKSMYEKGTSQMKSAVTKGEIF